MKELDAARVRNAPTRCPYCHDACEPGADEVVCRACLSRHHEACWGEAGACASCGGGDLLQPGRRPPLTREHVARLLRRAEYSEAEIAAVLSGQGSPRPADLLAALPAALLGLVVGAAFLTFLGVAASLPPHEATSRLTALACLFGAFVGGWSERARWALTFPVALAFTALLGMLLRGHVPTDVGGSLVLLAILGGLASACSLAVVRALRRGDP